MASGALERKELNCSFCGKNQYEVIKLIAGPTVFSCNECIELCLDIIKEETKVALKQMSSSIPTPQRIFSTLNYSCYALSCNSIHIM